MTTSTALECGPKKVPEDFMSVLLDHPNDPHMWHEYLSSLKLEGVDIENILREMNVWSCSNCTRLNVKESFECVLCSEPRHNDETEADASTAKLRLSTTGSQGASCNDKTSSKCLLGFDSGMLEHLETGGSQFDVHPERPDRLRSLYNHLCCQGLLSGSEIISAKLATLEDLLLAHTPAHIKHLVQFWSKPSTVRENDTFSCDGSRNAVLLSCGITMEVTRRVVQGEAKSGFCCVRPPGHHAESEKVMGFCHANAVAVAAQMARRKLGVNRVLILDWDIHHGNGTQEIFYQDPGVLYCSLHRHDRGSFFPYTGFPESTGNGKGKGYTINLAWDGPGAGDPDYIIAFTQLLMPVFLSFNPQLVVISAGFDAADLDPLGGCRVTPAAFAFMTHQLMSLAGGKVVAVLEGGYNLKATSTCAESVLRTLMGHPLPALAAVVPTANGLRAMELTRKIAAPYWKVLQHIRFLDIDEQLTGVPPPSVTTIAADDETKISMSTDTKGNSIYVFHDSLGDEDDILKRDSSVISDHQLHCENLANERQSETSKQQVFSYEQFFGL